MAECCKGSGCQELLTIGALKDWVGRMPSNHTCPVEIADGETATTCCNQSLSGDYQVVKVSDIGTESWCKAPRWIDSQDPRDCINGFDISGATTASTCCGNALFNDYVLAKEDVSLKCASYSSFTYSSAVTISPCGGNYVVSGTAKYNKYEVLCNRPSTRIGTATTAVTINSGEVGQYVPTAVTEVTDFESGQTDYSTRTVTSGTYEFETFTACSSSVTLPYKVEQEPINVIYEFSLSGNGTCVSALTGSVSVTSECDGIGVYLAVYNENGVEIMKVTEGLGDFNTDTSGLPEDETSFYLSGTVYSNEVTLLTVNIPFTKTPCSKEVDGAKGCGIYWIRMALGNEYDGDIINNIQAS